MKLLYKKVLDNLRRTSYLNNNVYVEKFGPSIIDKLVEKCKFDISEIEDIDQQISNNDKLNCLISILIVKDDEIYDNFQTCLQENSTHVVEQMWKLETELRESCENCEKCIRKLLQDSYLEQTKTFVRFDEIQNTIIQHVRMCPEKNDTLIGVLDEQFMTDCIKNAFPKSQKKEQLAVPTTQKHGQKNMCSRNDSTSKTVIYGITKKMWRKETTDCSPDSCSSNSEDELETFNEVAGKKTYNVEEFADLVQEILDKTIKEWDTNIPVRIKEQRVDSEMYELMNDRDKELLFPRIGERIRIKTEYDKIKRGTSTIRKQQIRYECLRRFDRPAYDGTKYKVGSFVRCMSRRPGNLITPVHKFFMFKNSSAETEAEDDCNSFLQEIINFAASCMNDRTNGTFHAGISEQQEIVGCKIKISNIDFKLTNAIKANFKEYQVAIALKCIRPPKYIEVVGDSLTTETLHVIEVDVVPFSKIVNKEAFFVKCNTKGSYLFYRFQGEVKIQDSTGIEDYMQKEKTQLIDQRIESELNRWKGRKENLNKRLKDFLCGGDDELDESLYPVLVLSHLRQENIDVVVDAEFLKDIPWRSVLDFNFKTGDSGFQVALEKKHAKCFLTYNAEDFNPRKRDKKVIEQTMLNVRESSVPTWIYCNGSNENGTKTDARTWIHNKFDSFRKVLDFFTSMYSDGRSRIILPLFEKESYVNIEAIAEIILQFGKQCVVLCPSQSIASKCYDELSRRPNIFPHDCSIDDCLLIGLHWDEVNECISGILKTSKRAAGIQIPRSNGGLYTVEEKVVNELSDLEIVGINQCRDIEQLTADQTLLREQEVREDYYSGGYIQWDNFYFEGQVLVRDVHKELEKYVIRALNQYDPQRLTVEKVVLYHQPGSGGSTSSRQILWNLKETYRCCVVKKVTDQTCDQIGRFRHLGENGDGNDINPILVLIDNSNEEDISRFENDLEDESTKYSFGLFCVLLICYRVSELPLDRPPKCLLLRQKLYPKENDWFSEKYNTLLEKNKEKRGCDPRTLLAFNIMKENFNKETIRKYVRDFVRDRLITEQQMKLLKYLSFFSTFDLHFQSITTSCFDPIMKPSIQWIKYLPPPVRVLTNRCRKPGYGGDNSAIRMSHYLLSRPVLDAILENERKLGACQNTIGEVALEVMGSECFQECYKYENKLLRNILGDIMKKRDKCSSEKSETGKLEKFSPLILELFHQKDSDIAVRIVSMAYDITDDPLVAQQLARVNADLGNWDTAHEAIDKAIDQEPNNSYIVHTKGQLYKDQLQQRFSTYMKDGSKFPKSFVNDAISMTQKAIKCYMDCQCLSESQDISLQNPAGYESAILIAIDLLRLLDRCQELHPLCVFLKGTPSEDVMSLSNLNFLKALPELINVTVEKLELILHGVNRNLFHGQSRSVYTVDAQQLDKHKREFVTYFCEDDENVSVNIGEKFEQANVYSFISAYRYDNIQLLSNNLEEMSRRTNHLGHHNLRKYLAMSISVALTNPSNLIIQASQLLSLSRQYYDKSTSRSELALLESYLYFITLHWPLPTRKALEDKISPYSNWSKALSSWLDFCNKKSNKRREKIFFYLGNSANYPAFVKNVETTGLSRLAKFPGIVNDNGTEVTITIHSFQSEKGHSVKIPLFRRIVRNLLYNRGIEVVVGFGLQGPKAVWLEEPYSSRIPRKPNMTGEKPRQETSSNSFLTPPITTSQEMVNNYNETCHHQTLDQSLLPDEHQQEKSPKYQNLHPSLLANRYTRQNANDANHPSFSLHVQDSRIIDRTASEDQILYSRQPQTFP